MAEAMKVQEECDRVNTLRAEPSAVDAKIVGISDEARGAVVIATGDGLRAVRHEGIQRRILQGV